VQVSLAGGTYFKALSAAFSIHGIAVLRFTRHLLYGFPVLYNFSIVIETKKSILTYCSFPGQGVSVRTQIVVGNRALACFGS